MSTQAERPGGASRKRHTGAAPAAEGLVKETIDRCGRVLGVGIAGVQAGKLIQEWVLAKQPQPRVGALATMIAPYPTLGEVSKRVVGKFWAAKLFSPRTRRLVRQFSRLG